MTSPRAATAVLASRAETPTRSSLVISLSSAQRPVSSSASSQPATRRGRSILFVEASPSTTSDSAGTCGGGLLWPMRRSPSPGGGGGMRPTPGGGHAGCRPLPIARPACRRLGLPSRGGMVPSFRPHQGDRLRQVADIVPGQVEQGRIGALLDEAADQPRLGVPERQAAGQEGQRPAALRIRAYGGNNRP